MITRRDVFAGLAAMSCAVEALAVPQPPEGQPVLSPEGQPILGPTVFAWDDMKPVKNATGEVRSLCKTPTATVDQLEMHVTTLDPGQSPHPPHRHVNEELVILREGHVETLSGGKWLKVEPGSVIFNASNSLHGLRNIGSTPAVYHVINWSPNKQMPSSPAS